METLKVISKEVERYFHLEPGSIQAKTNKREIVYPRQLAHFLAVEVNGNSLKRIGLELGLVDHATVLHSLRTISGYLDKDHRGRVIDKQAEKDVAVLRLKISTGMESGNMEWCNLICQY